MAIFNISQTQIKIGVPYLCKEVLAHMEQHSYFKQMITSLPNDAYAGKLTYSGQELVAETMPL